MNDEERAVVIAKIENGDDVRMRERCDGARFPLESSDRFGVARGILRQNLDRHFATEPRIAPAIDLTHPAFTQQRNHFIRTDSRAG